MNIKLPHVVSGNPVIGGPIKTFGRDKPQICLAKLIISVFSLVFIRVRSVEKKN
jgi:hypothetical protein